MNLKSIILLSAVSAIGAIAQPIGLGVKIGVPLTDPYKDVSTFTSDTKKYIVGPMIELRLPAGFSIEGDALYNKTDLSGPVSAVSSIATSVVNADSWEFPVLLKYKFGPKTPGFSIRPYVEAGASFRYITGLSDLPAFLTNGGVDKNNTGVTLGGGVEFKALFLRVSPELRYTHWGSDTFTGGLANIVWQTSKNQVNFLVGISF
jgi:hypothetical protein